MKNPIRLTEPIDYDRLEKAYSMAMWRWGSKPHIHFPRSEEIRERVESLKCDINSGGYSRLETGGLLVQKVDGGEIVVSIDPKLHDRIPPQP